VETIADTEFGSPEHRERTVVLYGNADTNAAWNGLLRDSPVQVRRDAVVLGDRTYTGSDLAAIFVQPRRDSDVASVVAVSGSGPVGMRLTDRYSFFYPFVRYPDCMIMRAEGLETDDVRTHAAGYFGLDWSVANGQFAYDQDTD
jgi:hypothetical protein